MNTATFFGSNSTTVGNEEVNVPEGAVSGFTFDNEVYTAAYSEGKFAGYVVKENPSHHITYSSIALPIVFATARAGAIATEAIETGFIASQADGPEPGPGDVGGGVLAGAGLILAAGILLHNLANEISLSPPKSESSHNAQAESSSQTTAIPKDAAEVLARIRELGKDYYIKYGKETTIGEIMITQTIRPNEKSKIYLTKSFFNEQEVEQNLFLNMRDGEGYGKWMVIFLVDPDQNADITKSVSDPLEWVHFPGSLKIRPGNLMYIGPNFIK